MYLSTQLCPILHTTSAFAIADSLLDHSKLFHIICHSPSLGENPPEVGFPTTGPSPPSILTTGAFWLMPVETKHEINEINLFSEARSTKGVIQLSVLFL